MANTCAIVIPIYNDRPNIIEEISLESLANNSSKNTQKNYPIYFVGPKKIEKSIANYEKYFESTEFLISELYFEDQNFINPISYSQLLKSYDFYKKFEAFDYIFIYQTDCFMIKDDLKKWISEGYDYLGASILVNTNCWKFTPIVGNGGCSLRKVSWFLEVTDPNGEFMQKFGDNISKEKAKMEDGYNRFEDVYFAELISYYRGMNKPDIRKALDFCFDMNPDIAVNVKLNQDQLPSFLHAFDKNLRWYNTQEKFKKIFPENKFDSLYQFSENKHKELLKYYMSDLSNDENKI